MYPRLICSGSVSEAVGICLFLSSASLLSLSNPHPFRHRAQGSYHPAPSLSLRHVSFPDATISQWPRPFLGSPEDQPHLGSLTPVTSETLSSPSENINNKETSRWAWNWMQIGPNSQSKKENA